MGGDFNDDPSAVALWLADCPHARKAGAVIAASQTATCFASGAVMGRILDFFVLSRCLSAVVESVTAEAGSCVATHLPVTLRWVPRLAAVMVRVSATRATVPPDPPFGPRPRPFDWTPVLRDAGQLAEDVAAAANGYAILASLAGQFALRRDAIAEAWASAAAADLEAVHGLKQGALHGLGVPAATKFAPLSVALSVKASRRPTPSAALAWGISVLTELAALVARLSAGPDRGPGTHSALAAWCPPQASRWGKGYALPDSRAWAGGAALRG